MPDGWLLRFSPDKGNRACWINSVAEGRLPLQDLEADGAWHASSAPGCSGGRRKRARAGYQRPGFADAYA